MHAIGGLLMMLLLSVSAFAQIGHFTDTTTYHLRNGSQPEWTEFQHATGRHELLLHFQVDSLAEHSLSLVQYDVKQNWDVLVNQRKIGSLLVDGNRMKIYFKIDKAILKPGSNELTIQTNSEIVDDVVINNIKIERANVDSLLSQCTIDLQVTNGKGMHMPARITIADENGILQSTGTKPADNLAIRPGTVYTSNGRASLSVPPGHYRIYATRGFEYGVDSFSLQIRAGQKTAKQLAIDKEVNTEGWISSDTHIHTLTNSGHGDATNRERALTIAGEGIELPVITEHNKVKDFIDISEQAKVDPFYTVVHGNEVTTTVGHFNVFPAHPGSIITDHTAKDWATLSFNLPRRTDTVVILNHGRDLHNGFRPFDSTKHISPAGYRIDRWPVPVNAMEVVNSGALLSDPMSLFHDWFGLLNHGNILSPIGSSDSHDVSRYLVGQARTYIKLDSRQPAQVDALTATANLRQGKVMVCFGLLTKITVDKKFGPGDMALYSQTHIAEVEVAGPAWIRAEKVSVYANGIRIFEESITDKNSAGTKWKKQIKLPLFKQDVFLVAIAEGDGSHQTFWPIVKPFQPVNPNWKPYTLGASGAVFLDVDHDGKFSTANMYARKLISRYEQDLEGLLRSLSAFDQAVAWQAAAVLHETGVNLKSETFKRAISKTDLPTYIAFQKFMQALENTKP